jgi:hypothetical protein
MSAMLEMTPQPAIIEKNLINVASTQLPTALRVVPGQPSASYLYCKVNPDCEGRAPMTKQMPLNTTPLSPAELKTISDWIVNGAPTQ